MLQTSDKRGAGTSANGVISIIGSLAEAGPVQLVNNGNSFQRGQLDEITVEELPDVGHIQQVRKPWPVACRLCANYLSQHEANNHCDIMVVVTIKALAFI